MLHQENWHGRGVHFNESVQVQKMESDILRRMIAEQQWVRELIHLVCFLAVEKCEKVESVNTQNDYETNK